jgi:hypothetical protein
VTPLLPGLRAKTPADLARARERVPWVDDEDLREVERKSRAGAAALSFFTWGGGHLYVGDTKKGAALIVALFAWVAASGALPEAIGSTVVFVVSVLSAVWSYRKAQDVNRFVGTRNEVMLRQGPDPSAYRLLHEAAAVNPNLVPALPASPAPLLAAGAPPGEGHAGPHGELTARLRKLASLRQADIITDAELRSRKIDILSELAPASADELDDLLYALLPLAGEGVLDTDDFDFLKQLGGAPGGSVGGTPGGTPGGTGG